MWGDREIADDEVVRLSRLPCLGCARAYPGVRAPLFIHPCVCGEWHRVCAVCVIQEKLIAGGPKPGSNTGRFGLLERCPYPLRVANELMGDVEDDARRTPRRKPTLRRDFVEEMKALEPVKAPGDLGAGTKRPH